MIARSKEEFEIKIKSYDRPCYICPISLKLMAIRHEIQRVSNYSDKFKHITEAINNLETEVINKLYKL